MCTFIYITQRLVRSRFANRQQKQKMPNNISGYATESLQQHSGYDLEFTLLQKRILEIVKNASIASAQGMNIPQLSHGLATEGHPEHAIRYLF